MGTPKIDVLAMTPAERLDLMSRIWESFTRDPDSLPVTKAVKRELDKRLRACDAGRMPLLPADEAFQKLRRRKNAPG
jgi:putative addiction module component (TIGR02574 family)